MLITSTGPVGASPLLLLTHICRPELLINYGLMYAVHRRFTRSKIECVSSYAALKRDSQLHLTQTVRLSKNIYI